MQIIITGGGRLFRPETRKRLIKLIAGGLTNCFLLI
ncbi:Uncharacterised protein [Salmonella enterica subsp. enterica]|uniref:Uncharacterized protein n=1 Tax=Salmonella enterica I TaxID=59201 RepID=A0A379WMX4_SALET|nr:Uncharacterised protein [Salmonella enterica subsp. enterica]